MLLLGCPHKPKHPGTSKGFPFQEAQVWLLTLSLSLGWILKAVLLPPSLVWAGQVRGTNISHAARLKYKHQGPQEQRQQRWCLLGTDPCWALFYGLYLPVGPYSGNSLWSLTFYRWGNWGSWNYRWFAQGHTGSKQWVWDLNPGSLAPELMLLTFVKGAFTQAPVFYLDPRDGLLPF